MLIVDAHQDLAWNMLQLGRDYTLSAHEIRQREMGTLAPDVNGEALLGYPNYQQGQVALIFATLFAAPLRKQAGEWETLCYQNTMEANRLYRQQVEAYQRLADDAPEKFHLIRSQPDLEQVIAAWEPQAAAPAAASSPVGLAILMEGAEGVRAPAELQEWWELGVRMIGPAWAGTRFCGGTREPGPLTSEGFELLEAMASYGFGLDLSHMDEKAALQALDAYPGTILVSHSHPAALLKERESNRFLSDRVLHGLLERDAVIGMTGYNLFLSDRWEKGDRREFVSLENLAAHIDYICQMAGDALHAGLGTDFDGGFGVEAVPPEIDTIADLQKLAPLLSQRGYSQEDIAAIFGGNWLRTLHGLLPEHR